MKDVPIDRRAFLARASAIGGITGFSGAWASDSSTESPVVKTANGQLRGIRENGVIVFKGVPYAGPWEGENRFKPPRKLEPWKGVETRRNTDRRRFRIAILTRSLALQTGIPRAKTANF